MQNKVYITFVFFGLLGVLSFCALAFNLKSVTEIKRLPGSRQPGASPPMVSQELNAKDWPSWRGRDFTGRAPSSNPPLHWTETENIRWRASLPGVGHSSPIVRGERLFLTAADDANQTQSLICIDRTTGALQWEKSLHQYQRITKHAKNSHASPTPVCDGRLVYVVFAHSQAVWASAVNLQGEVLWQTEVGPFYAEWGYGSSPVLHQGLLIVAGDNKQETLGRFRDTAFLAALDISSGKILWRIRRPGQNSYATPIVARFGGEPQLLLSGRRQVHSYNPLNGKILWECSWPAHRTAGTMAFQDDLVFATCGKGLGRQLVAIRATGRGDVTETHTVWRYSKNTADVPSPLVHDGRLFMVSDEGVATCLTANTGKPLWKKRLGGRFFSSPILAGRHVYAVNEAGETFVFRAADEFHLESTNKLREGEAVYATPAVSGNQMFIRTTEQVYCMEQNPTESTN